MKKTLRIKFVDFYPNFNPQKVSIWQPLWRHYDVQLSDEPEWLVYSVFGNEHLNYNNCVKIFFTGENQAPDFNLCDYALGFEHMQFGDRYLRFPLWVMYPQDTQPMLHKHEQPSLAAKSGFCSFVVSNANSSAERETFFDLLSRYKTVNSGGRWRNNVGGPVADKLEFQSRHKFSIAFENTSHPGYTTEKLAQSFAAQTVPIYWGDPLVADVFNPDAFVNCHDFASWDEVIDRIRQIDNNDALWLQMVSTPALRDPQLVERTMADVEAFLCHIFDQTPLDARRFSRDYWALKQLKIRQKLVRTYRWSPAGLAERFYVTFIRPFTRNHASVWSRVQRMNRKLHFKS